MKNEVLSARNLSIGYKSKRNNTENVLYSGLDFKLYSSELTCLLGGNGAGKSTLLKTLNTSLAPIDGAIEIFGKNLKQYKENDLSKILGLVLTEKINAGGLRVKELVSLGRYPYTGFFGKTTETDEQIVSDAMRAVSIDHKSDCYIAELSDGERQKVMIAKALAQECPIIMLDEPTAFLDATSRIEVMTLLQKLARTQNKAILLSTHDIDLATTMADRLWLISKTDGFETGTTEDLVFADAINRYIGTNDIQFDKTIGAFAQNTNYTQYISVIGNESPTLSKWLQFFLTRHQYGLAKKNTPQQDIKFEIEAINHNLFRVKNMGTKEITECRSFSELSRLI